MVRQQRTSKVHEDRYPSCHSRETSEHPGKDELVKRDMLDPPRYLRRAEDIRGKALSFGVLDWKQFEKWKDTEGTKGACCSYASSYTGSVDTAASSLELDLATGVVKRLEIGLEPQASFVSLSPPNMDDSFTVRSQDQPLSRKQKEHQAYLNKNLVEKEHTKASDGKTNPGLETSSKPLSKAFRTVECQDRRPDVPGECSSPANVMEMNQNSLEKPSLLDQKIPKGRHASPNRRFSFSFSQMSRSFSSKESSASVPALSSTSHASAKSGPLTFNDSARTKPNGHSRTRSGPIVKPKTEKNVSLQVASKPSNARSPTSSRSHAILQFTLRKGISLFQFVVDNNSNNVLAATMKSSDSSTRSYTLYTVNEVKNKSGNWLGRHRNDHPFVHTIIGQMKTNSDLTQKSESVCSVFRQTKSLQQLFRQETRFRNKAQLLLYSQVEFTRFLKMVIPLRH